MVIDFQKKKEEILESRRRQNIKKALEDRKSREEIRIAELLMELKELDKLVKGDVI